MEIQTTQSSEFITVPSPIRGLHVILISLIVLFFLLQMAASNRKEGERTPTPSAPMEKTQMRLKCDFS